MSRIEIPYRPVRRDEQPEKTSSRQGGGVRACAIFPDKALIDMAAKRPANDEVFGVGKAKQKKFGALFLKAIQEEAA